MVVNNDYNKIQINTTIDKDSKGNIIRQSLMLNIRTDNCEEAVTLYGELKNKLNGNITAVKVENQKTDENVPICDECGEKMILKKNGKKGNYFWGCSGFPNCRFTMPHEINSDQKKIPVVQVD